MAFGEGFGTGFAGKPTVGVPKFRAPRVVPMQASINIDIDVTILHREKVRAMVDVQIRKPHQIMIRAELISRVRARHKVRAALTVRKRGSVKATISAPIRRSERIAIESLSRGGTTPAELLEMYETFRIYEMSKVAGVIADA